MNIANHYNFSQGLSVISHYGLQKYTEKLDSYSSILNSIYTSDYNKNNKFCVDSCWESGNIYYANYDEGYVKKIKFDGTVLATLNLSRPFMVSIIQNSSSMNSTVSYPPQEEIGCWIADKGTGKIIKTDNNLNIIKEIDYIINPIGLIADVDGGCYVVSYYITSSIKGNLLKISSDGEVVGIKNYSDFSPSITGFIDMSMDSNGQLYFCANDKVYALSYSDGNILQNYVLSPITTDDPFSSSSSEVFVGEEKHLGCIDIDRNSQYQPLYIAGGNSAESFIVKYVGGGLAAEKQYYDMGMPYVIKAIQGMGSDSLYVLEDSSKWDDYGYGSSSSIDSSSSSSSSSSI